MNPYFKTPPAVKNLIIANCLIFLATYLIPQVDSLLGRYGQLFWIGSPLFHSYQFVSYMFLHGSFSHLFFNMFALWMFGRTLEYELGTKRFLTYYFVCGIGAALFQMLVAWVFGEIGFTMLGASGATMGLLMAFGVMHPNNQIFVFPIPMPIKAKWFVVGYIILELFQGWGVNDGIAHFAHVGGMLWGWALLYYWKNKRIIYF
ncbi:MAG: rhomboid family intramembrane serine protease [Alistipes sp.]|jgi:membrane associated rhomboid family serine protease|nr:rhomboid family intramembrane serine protease [Alistipes sp.]